jgi:hypothetical protein
VARNTAIIRMPACLLGLIDSEKEMGIEELLCCLPHGGGEAPDT